MAQFGVVSRDQGVIAGVSARAMRARRDAGRLEEVLPGVYRFASAPRTFRQRAMAAALWSEPEGLVSHQTAGALWRLEGIGHGGRVHITLPGGHRRHRDITVHTSRDLIDADRARCGPIAVTSALRTVLDLAATVEPLALEVAIEDGLRRRLFTLGQLHWRSAQRLGRGVSGSTIAADLISRRDLGVTDSGWEVRVSAMLVKEGMGAPVRQLAVRTAMGDFRVDLGYPGPPVVALEYDSDRWHSGVQRRHADAARRNALRIAGVNVVEITSSIAHDPVALVELVRAALSSRAS